MADAQLSATVQGASFEDNLGPPPSSKRVHPLDDWLLHLVQRAFSAYAGPDSRIDATELQRSLEINNPVLAQRLLSVFDGDGDGVVSRVEFLEGVRRLVFGSVRARLRFAFRLHDLNGDQVIERSELLEMIALSMAEENAAFCLQDAGRLTDMLLKAADRNEDGRISYREFESVLFRHPEVLELITRCEAQWVSPNEDLVARLEKRESRASRLRRYLDNHLSLVLLAVVWIGVNVALFAHAVQVYQVRGPWVQLARGCGACMNFNGALIFIPVMRGLLTRVRRTPVLRALPVDEALSIHRFLGHVLFALALVHSLAHLANTWLTEQGRLFGPWLSSRAGLTGIALLAVFLILWVSALPVVRRLGRFEQFYYFHLLYLAWAALALLHAPVFWIWAGVPLLGIFVDRVLSALRSSRTEILSAEALRSGVTRLRICKPQGFEQRPGDYLFLNIPAVARYEWHPFTISSAPEAEHLTVHVRSLGDFTGALRRLAEARHANGEQSTLPVHLDGPHGTASCHVFESRHAVLIGAGIGVTPFASVLESLVLRAERGIGQLQKAHFFWLNRDPYSFEWFAGLLRRLEAIDRDQKIEIRICMTGGRGNVTATALNLAREVSHALGNPDWVTGLRAKTCVGAPDWTQELRAIRDQHAPEPVDVFYCGPPGLARRLKRVSTSLGQRFREEHF